MKLIALCLFLFCLLEHISSASSCDGTTRNPCLVQDTSAKDKLKHWRDARILAKAYKGDVTGLQTLRISGSAAPSARGWKTVIKNVESANDESAGEIIDVDLRQESHGYLNEQAINLTAQSDWINLGKTRDQALSSERDWLRSLRSEKFVSNVLEPKQFKSGKFDVGKRVSIRKVQSEEDLVKALGLRYFRLTVSDHRAPEDTDVDRFVEAFQSWPKTAWVHFHCRGGDGRTTTFMAMYDMLVNADRVSFDEILKRQGSVPPHYDLFHTASKDEALANGYRARLEFLRNFYQFARVRLRGESNAGQGWSRWRAGT